MPNTCKSNGVLQMEFFGTKLVIPSGGRVSNAWVTCPFVGNNFEKLKLIPHNLESSHEHSRKDGLSMKLSQKDGPASD